MVDWQPRIRVNIPAGVSGNWEVAHYTNQTTDNHWQLYLQMKQESFSNYTVLLRSDSDMPVMQDSRGEYREHQWLWDNATGDVLIGGLGLGMVHEVLKNNSNVTSVTVIENSQDVIDLVWPYCVKDETFTLIKADIETWTPPQGSSWDVAWFDTWDVKNSLTWDAYKNLMQTRYSSYCTEIGFWGSIPVLNNN